MSSEEGKELFEGFGAGSGEGGFLVGFGVGEGEFGGVEEVVACGAGDEVFVGGLDIFPEGFGEVFGAGVLGVGYDRVGNFMDILVGVGAGEVDADLVGAACFQFTFDEGESVVEALEDFIVGGGRFSLPLWHDGHALAVFGVAADIACNGAAFLLRDAVDEGMVGTVGGFVSKLVGEVAVGDVVFRADDEACGVFVEPVDDAGALLAVDAR